MIRRGQGDSVAQAEIEALAGDRVDAVGGVTDDGEAFGGEAVHIHGRERIQPAAADRADVAEMITEADGDFGTEGRAFQRHQPGRGVRAFGPDDGGDVVAGFAGGHRELGEGAGGEEMLQRGVVVRAVVGRWRRRCLIAGRPSARR